MNWIQSSRRSRNCVSVISLCPWTHKARWDFTYSVPDKRTTVKVFECAVHYTISCSQTLIRASYVICPLSILTFSGSFTKNSPRTRPQCPSLYSTSRPAAGWVVLSSLSPIHSFRIGSISNLHVKSVTVHAPNFGTVYYTCNPHHVHVVLLLRRVCDVSCVGINGRRTIFVNPVLCPLHVQGGMHDEFYF